MKAAIQAFFDPQTSTVSYLVSDPASGRAVIIDPVLDYDPKSARTSTRPPPRGRRTPLPRCWPPSRRVR